MARKQKILPPVAHQSNRCVTPVAKREQMGGAVVCWHIDRLSINQQIDCALVAIDYAPSCSLEDDCRRPVRTVAAMRTTPAARELFSFRPDR